MVIGSGGLVPYVVENEEQAWQIFQEALAGDLDQSAGLVFDGWPHLEVTYWLPGDGDAVITPPMMRGLLQLQGAIHRTHLWAVDRSTNLRALSDEDRRRYEIRARVSNGSTSLSIDLQGLAQQFITEIVGKMPPEYLLTFGLGAALLWTGSSVWRAWLQKRGEQARDEARSGDLRQLLDAQRFASEQDLARWRLMLEAFQHAPLLSKVEDVTEPARETIVRAASSMERTRVAGTDIDPVTARNVAKRPAKPEIPGRIDGTFRILRVDTTTPDGFRVQLENTESGETFFSWVRDALLSEQDRAFIQEGEWAKRPVEAQVNISRRDGEIIDAVVYRVIRVLPSDDDSSEGNGEPSA